MNASPAFPNQDLPRIVRPRLRNHIPYMIISLGLVLLLTVWSLISQPTATFIARLSQEQPSFSLAEDEGGITWWQARVNLDTAASESPFVLVAEDDQSYGHRLYWHPERLLWRLTRRADQGPLLLAQGRLEALPRRLTLSRYGYRLELAANEQLLVSCYDLSDTPAIRQWRIEQEHGSINARIDIHNLSYQATVAHDESAVIKQLVALLDDFLHRRHNDHLLFQQAGNLISYFQHSDHCQAKLWTWLMWSYGKGLAQHSNDFAALDAVIAYLLVAAQRDQAPSEVPGLLLDLYVDTLRQARRIPVEPTRSADFVNKRRAWLALSLRINTALTELAEHSQASIRGHFLDRHERFLLILMRQLALVSRGDNPVATPAEAPAWLSLRIRALSGRLPLELPMPEIPRSWPEAPWINTPLQQILRLVDNMEPEDVLKLRAQVLSSLRQQDEGETEIDSNDLWALIEQAPISTRLTLLYAGVLTLEGSLAPAIGLDALTRPDADGVSLIERDPLAYALYRLILDRQPEESGPSEQPYRWGLPPGLSPYRQLLDGGYGATIIAFSRPGGTISPPESLAAALAMQEVSGIRPQWELLKGLPSLHIPLHLIIPPDPEPIPPFSGSSPDPSSSHEDVPSESTGAPSSPDTAE